MRFGKRGRGRSIGRREASKVSKKSITSPVPQQGSVAPLMQEVSSHSDARTQEILAHLEHFSKQLTIADPAQWSDACMHDLIACMEISVEEGWSDLSKVLADTGRVLQTYENAQRAAEAVSFLQNAYDAMCRLVGDMVIEKPTAESLANWNAVFTEGQKSLTAKGLVLFDDESAPQHTEDTTTSFASPNEIAAEHANEMQASFSHTLPVLGELPPLESLVSFDSYAAKAKEEQASEDVAIENTTQVFNLDEEPAIDDQSTPEEADSNVIAFAHYDTPEAEVVEDISVDEAVNEIVEEPVDDTPVEQYDPPRIVVDIIDRICDVLGVLEHDSGDARMASLNVMTSGLEALAHEAHLMKSEAAEEACVILTKACTVVVEGDDAWSDGLVEQSFAFCGVFIEALSSPNCENIMTWQQECLAWIDSCQSAPVEATEAPTEAAGTVEEAPVEETVLEEPFVEAQYEVIDTSTPAVVADEVEATIAQEEMAVESNENIVEEETITEAKVETEAKSLVDEAEMGFTERSQNLLKMAQEAALKGNAEDVKTFALRAAAEMAKAEVYRAETQLRECEIKLTQGIQNTEDARGSVKACEVTVQESTELVGEIREIHGEAQKSTAAVVATLETLEAGVADLNHQIQELQAQRDTEQGKVSETVQDMENKRNAEQQALNEWDELKVLEGDSRQRLEGSRQHVKDRQRMVQDIESSMEAARETMTREKGSLSDITQTIQQLSGAPSTDDDSEDTTLLF